MSSSIRRITIQGATGREISVASLLAVFARCIGTHEKLLRSQSPEFNVPSWSQVLAEALEARERIFQSRQSRLFRCHNSRSLEDTGKESATKLALETAQCLSAFPLGFLRFWFEYLQIQGRNPSDQIAAEYLHDVDCPAHLATIETGVKKAREILIEESARLVRGPRFAAKLVKQCR